MRERFLKTNATTSELLLAAFSECDASDMPKKIHACRARGRVILNFGPKSRPNPERAGRRLSRRALVSTSQIGSTMAGRASNMADVPKSYKIGEIGAATHRHRPLFLSSTPYQLPQAQAAQQKWRKLSLYVLPAGRRGPSGRAIEQVPGVYTPYYLYLPIWLGALGPTPTRERRRAVQRPPYPAREVGRRGARIGSQRDSKHSEETQTQTVLFKRTPIAVCPRGVTRIFPPREADSAQAFFARADK